MQYTKYSGSDDRWIVNSSTVYATVRNAASGTASDPGTSQAELHNTYSSPTYYLYRFAIWFDLSALPASSVIDAATLYLYVVSTNFGGGQTGVCLCAPASGYPSRPAVDADYDRTRIGDVISTRTSYTTSAYNAWTITPTTLIKPGSWNAFYFRPKGDVDNTAPTAVNRMNTYLGRATLESNRPKLVINYHPADEIKVFPRRYRSTDELNYLPDYLP